MYPFILFIMLWVWDNVTLPSTSLLSVTQNEAEAAFMDGDYEEASLHYQQIVEGSIYSDPAARLNMATAYFMAGEYELAQYHYQLLTRVENKSLASVARAQMAQLALIKTDTVTALAHLQEAIRIDRKNSAIIKAYEVLAYRYSGTQVPQLTSVQREEQVTTQMTEQEAPQMVPDAGQQRDQLLQNLDRLNMTEDQAQAVLDAMKTNEMQYIYQLRRAGANGKETNKKIEW